VIRAVLDNGEPAAWMTNLVEGTAEEIKQLYRKRWAIEQKYHALKNKMKFESVTGKASVYVKQDFWAQALAFNMIQDLVAVAEGRAQKKARSKKYLYSVQINENMAIGLFKEQFIRLILEEEEDKQKEMAEKLMADIERHIVPIRTLKSAPRKPRKSNKYKCNQKPTF
jgi:transposase